jgi:hypothetical protein
MTITQRSTALPNTGNDDHIHMGEILRGMLRGAMASGA